MGRRGPKPIPTSLKVLQGTARPEDLRRNEPKPKPVAPDKPPTWLPREAKKKWKELAPELERIGLLTAVDGPAFAMLLLHWALAVDAAKTLKKEGITTVDERGLPRKHPLLQVLRDNSQAFKQYAAEFGLTPSARARLDMAKDEEIDDFTEFLLNNPARRKRRSE